jgi:hypothetical protein
MDNGPTNHRTIPVAGMGLGCGAPSVRKRSSLWLLTLETLPDGRAKYAIYKGRSLVAAGSSTVSFALALIDDLTASA